MSNLASKVSFLALFVVLMIAFGVIIKPFLAPGLIALIIAVICWPINRFCLQACRGRRTVAAFLATMIVACCVLVPLGSVLTFAAVNSMDAVKSVLSRLEAGTIAHSIDGITAWLQAKIALVTQAEPSALDLRAKLIELLKSIGAAVYSYSPRVFTATAGFFAGFLLVVIFLFIFFTDGERLQQALLSLVPLAPEHKQVLVREVSGVITGTFAGMMATALAQGTLLGIGYLIAGIPNPVVWGAVAVVVTMIPVIGGPIMYIPVAAALVIGGSIGKGIFLLVWGVGLVSTVDNVIKPLIMRGKVNVHPVLLALAIIGGSMWLGAIGFIIGPVVAALMLAMLRIYRREFL